MTTVDEINVPDLSFSSHHPSSTSLSTDAKTYHENSSVLTTSTKNENDHEKEQDKVSLSICKGTFESLSLSTSSSSLLSHKSSHRLQVQSHTDATTIKEHLNDGLSKENIIHHAWSKVEGGSFHVRSKSYLQSKEKTNSLGSLFTSRGVDFFMTETFGPTNIGR